MLKAFSKKDPPPHRVKPVPVAVLRNVAATAANSQCPHRVAKADMTILAFFFLLRPGEYTCGSSDTVPFRFQDVQLFIGPTRLLDLVTASIASLRQATFGTLTFTNQKNGVTMKLLAMPVVGIQFFVLSKPLPVVSFTCECTTLHQLCRWQRGTKMITRSRSSLVTSLKH
jgi:hypothetical protein